MADTQYDEKKERIRRIIVSVLIGVLVWLVASLIIFPLQHFALNGFSITSVKKVADFYRLVFTLPKNLLLIYARWLDTFKANAHLPIAMYLPFLPFIIVIYFYCFETIKYLKNNLKMDYQRKKVYKKYQQKNNKRKKNKKRYKKTRD